MFTRILLAIVLTVSLNVVPSSSKPVYGVNTPVPNISIPESCDWPMFGRTPDGNRVALDECGPSGDKVRLKWKWEPYIGDITTNQVINNGLIYAGSATGKMYCIRESDRTKIWEYQTGKFIYNSAPVITNSRIYFGSDDCNFYCLNIMSGEKIWDFKTGGMIRSTAIAINNRIYFGSDDGTLYCLDALTGSKYWAFQTYASIFNSSPILSNNRLIFGATNGIIYCLEINNGSVIWEYKTGSGISNSSLVNDDSDVYLKTEDNIFYSLNINTGNRNWEYQSGLHIGSSPTVLNNKFIFGDENGKLHCLDLYTRETIWEFQASQPVRTTAVIINNKVYFSGDKLYCLDFNTGVKYWEYKNKIRSGTLATIINERIYFSSNDGKLYCLDSVKGEMYWEYQTGYSFQNSPSISDKRVYFGTDVGKLYCLESTTGRMLWDYQTGGSIKCSPAISDKKVFFGSDDGKLYCLDSATGSMLWEYQTGGYVESSITISNNKLFFGSGDGKLYCLDSATGRMFWYYQTEGCVQNSPTVSDNKVFYGSQNGMLYCLDLATGRILWDYQINELSFFSLSTISNNNIYFTSLDGNIYCLEANTGTKIWEYKTEDQIFMCSPSISNNRIYIGSNAGKLFCLDAAKGIKLWDFKTTGINSSPAISNNMIYFGSGEKKLFCLDVSNGIKLWDYDIAYWMNNCSPVLSNGLVYFGSNDCNFYCLETYSDYTDDVTPPKITLINPESNNAIIPEGTTTYQIEYRVTDESGISSITFNDIPMSINDNGNYVCSVKLNQGENIFIIKAVDNSSNKNSAEYRLSIFVETKPQDINIQLSEPTISPDTEYNRWILTQPKEYKSMTFSDIDFGNFNYNGDGQIIKLASTNTPGKPDIPCFAVCYKLPEGQVYDSYEYHMDEADPLPLKDYIKPVLKQYPLPVGGKPYILPDKEEYGLLSAPGNTTQNKPMKINNAIVSGGNPYKWPPELYNNNSNEVIIYINPARYSKEDHTLRRIKDLKLKIKTRPKQEMLSSSFGNQITPQNLRIEIPYDMCIISNSKLIGTADDKMDDFADYAQSRTNMGVFTKCVDIESIYQQYPYAGDDFEKLQVFLYYEKLNSHIKYVLLGGESNIVPTAMVYAQQYDYNAIMPSDAYFSQSEINWGKINFDDKRAIGEKRESLKLNPDLFVGRVPVESQDELKMFIDKMDKYYRKPFSSTYNKSALLLGRKLDDLTNGSDILDTTVQDLPGIGLKYTRLYDTQPKQNNPFIKYFNPD